MKEELFYLQLVHLYCDSFSVLLLASLVLPLDVGKVFHYEILKCHVLHVIVCVKFHF